MGYCSTSGDRVLNNNKDLSRALPVPSARRGASRRDKKSVQFFLTDSTRVQKSQLFFLYTSYRRETTKKENATFLEIIVPLLISLRVPGYLRLILVLYHYAPRNLAGRFAGLLAGGRT